MKSRKNFAAGTKKPAARFPFLTPEQLTPAQAKYVRALLAGPRGGGDSGPEAIAKMIRRGPFNAWLRSPELGERLQLVGEQLRYNSSLPLHLNEFAILITARHWTSQYEWYAHLPHALKAGLDPKIAGALARNKRPARMKAAEAAVYDFCTQLHRKKNVTDAAFSRARTLFGEHGVMDLIGVCGYYTAVSMTLNIAAAPLPPGEKNPLK